MTVENMATSQQREQTKPTRGFSWLFLAVIGAVVCAGAVMLAHGNGISPIYYLLFELLLLPPIAKFIGRHFKRCRSAELGVILLGATLCAGVAYVTSHPSPKAIFRHNFEIDAPTSVINLAGKKQWYDGRIWLVSFQASDSDFAQLVATSHLKLDSGLEIGPDAIKGRWYVAVGQWGQISYQYWPTFPDAKRAILYTREDETSDMGGPNFANVFRDVDTGETWVVRLD